MQGDTPAFGDRPDQDEDGEGASIREIQKRRRDEARLRADVEALLAAPLEDDEEDGEPVAGAPLPGAAGAPAAAAPAKVWVVFQGAKWEDPDGGLRESDAIAGIYATEEAAWKAAAQLRKDHSDREDAWYQPYTLDA